MSVVAATVKAFSIDTSSLTEMLPDETVEVVEEITKGYSCRKYMVTTTSNRYFLRILNQKKDTSLEIRVTVIAAELGISPQLKAQNKDQLLLEYIPTVTWPSFKEDPRPFCEVMSRLKLFHEGSSKLLARKDAEGCSPFSHLITHGNEMLRSISSLPRHFSHSIETIHLVFKSLLPCLREQATYCHGDFHKDNTLYDGKRVFLIDWETVTWGDPIVDIVKFSLTLEEEERIQLYEEYLGHKPSSKELAHFHLIDITFLMVVVVNRLKLAYSLEPSPSEYLSKDEMEELLDSSEPSPSFLSVSYGDSSPKGRQKGALYALKEFMARTSSKSDFSSWIDVVKSV